MIVKRRENVIESNRYIWLCDFEIAREKNIKLSISRTISS